MIVRQAQEEELKEIINLRLELVKAYPESFLISYEESQEITPEAWRKWFFSKNFILWVAEDKGKLIGMVGCSLGKYQRNKHQVLISALGVLPAYLGQGVGKALMTELISWVKKQRLIKRLQIDVYSDNQRAYSLYKKLGFKEEGVKKKYVQKPDGTFQDRVDLAMLL